MTSLLVACTAFDLHKLHDDRDRALGLASKVSDDLATLETVAAHRTRALYFDYIGETENALEEWREIENITVLFQAVTRFREGQFKQAKRVCDVFSESSRPDRMMDFIQTLILSATSTPNKFENAFKLRVENQLSPIHELLTVYTICCLRGDLDLAQREAVRLKQQHRFPKFLRRWYGRIEEYTCQDITAGQLIESADGSRKKLCEAHYYIGVTKLARGDREAALHHFQQSTALRIFNFYEHHLSFAMAKQLERQPTWPQN